MPTSRTSGGLVGAIFQGISFRAAAISTIASKERPFFLLTCLFMWEFSIAVMSVASYTMGDRPVTVFLSSASGMMFLMASAAFVIAAAAIFLQYLSSIRLRSRQFQLVVVMNLFMIVFMLTTAEIAIRVGTTSTTDGEKWRWRILVPKSWSKLALNTREFLDQRPDRFSYLVYDDLMGWTIGPNRRSADGLYYSSWEGIRAPREGVSFARSTKKLRIALVGDSFSFGYDVAYEDSWGYLLEKALGHEFEVLNFGVGMYGVDQAYLRYEKDVRQWKPNVVIFGLISDDVERTMRLYHILGPYPSFELPFSKPRMILHEGNLKKLNVPPITPQDLFSRASVSEVPFVEYDRDYKPSHWQSSFLHKSYLARAVMTIFPPWETGLPDNTDSALVSVNASILKAFVKSAVSEGTIPMLVYFPEKADFTGVTNALPIGKKVLQEANIAYTDITPCLMPLKPDDRFASKRSHYSPQGNARVAHCLTNVVSEALAAPIATATK